MRFTGQNKKAINPKYFLNEGVEDSEGSAIASYLPTPGKKKGIPGCKGAGELQKLLVDNYMVYQIILGSISTDKSLSNFERFKQMLSDGIIGHYYVLPINAFIQKILGVKRTPKNNVNTGYTDDMEGYKAICRDMFDLTQMMTQWQQNSEEAVQGSEIATTKPETPKTPEAPKTSTPEQPSGLIGRKIGEPEEGQEMLTDLGPKVFHNGEWIPKSEYEQLQKGLEEAKKRDRSYNRLKEEKNNKLFKALIKG